MSDMIGNAANRMALDDLQDEELVQQARCGDSAAFNELVSRHRVKAFTWATRISRDPHLAEDIVQEALIRAFLHLGTLVQDQRFLGWLKGIVRNQALMKLRRGGPHAKEMPMSSYQLPTVRQVAVDPYNLESIMDYLLTRTIANAATRDPSDPQLLMDREDWYRMVKGLLQCLSPRDKSIFEAHFFHDCSPDEIAELFQISKGNVYKIISRSRLKIQQQRLASLIRTHIEQRKEDGFMPTRTLDRHLLMNAGGSLLSGTETLYRFIKVRFPSYTLPYVEGFMLSAFILNIEKKRVDMSSTNMIDRNYLIYNGIINLGLEVRYVEAFDFEPPDAQLMTEAIHLVQQSIDRGMPAMVWELLRKEFGLIYGYDDDLQQFQGIDTQSDEAVPYDRLGRLQTRSLFVLGFQHEAAISPSDALWRFCKMISRHARGGDLTFTGYVNGLAAYDTWIEVFRNRAIEPLGHAYTISVVLQAREHAVKFLTEMIQLWEGRTEESRSDICGYLQEAASCYARSVDALTALGRMFPAPTGGEPNDPAVIDEAIALLQNVRAAEEAGVEAFERLMTYLQDEAPRTHVPPLVENPPRAYVM